MAGDHGAPVKKTARRTGRFQVTISFATARPLKSGRSSGKLYFPEFAALNLTYIGRLMLTAPRT